MGNALNYLPYFLDSYVSITSQPLYELLTWPLLMTSQSSTLIQRQYHQPVILSLLKPIPDSTFHVPHVKHPPVSPHSKSSQAHAYASHSPLSILARVNLSLSPLRTTQLEPTSARHISALCGVGVSRRRGIGTLSSADG
jgi:hypothetical protein